MEKGIELRSIRGLSLPVRRRLTPASAMLSAIIPRSWQT